MVRQQILIVDDDSDFRDELKDCLGDYKVHEASSGEGALELIRRPHAIDLILLDVHMPGLSGTDVLKAIKKISPHICIIILTGQSSKDIAVEALKGHADDYIEKPFIVEKFRQTVDLALAARERTQTKDGEFSAGKMERVKNFLRKNFDKKVGLKDVAEEICLSPKYLSRVFKERTGEGFNEFRLNLKMAMAGEWIKGGMTAQQAAERLGYKNAESFFRIFKKWTGHTPGAFRRAPKGKADGKFKGLVRKN